MRTKPERVKPSLRREILRAEGLEYAPAAAREAFWRQYNHGRRRAQRRPAKLGDLAAAGASRGMFGRTAGRLDQLTEAWRAVVPSMYLSETRIAFFRDGCLDVIVRNAAARFILERRFREKLLITLNQRLSGFRVSRISFRTIFSS